MHDKETIAHLREVIADLRAKLQYIVDNTKCEEGIYSFPDGDYWPQTGVEYGR